MRSTYKAGVSILLAACLLAGSTHAQEEQADDSQKARLLKFAANNSTFDSAVETLGRDLYRRQIESCTSIDQAVRQLPTPYGALEFRADINGQFPPPTSGLWAEHVKILGCGRVYQMNMLAVARPGKQPMLLALLPGETLSDPSAQRNAERIGAITVKKADDTCSDEARVGNTKLIGFKQSDGSLGKTDVQQGWFEEWTYRFCQKDVPVQMAFMPNDKGGFDIKARVAASGTQPAVPAPKPDAAAVAAPAETGAASPAAPAQ